MASRDIDKLGRRLGNAQLPSADDLGQLATLQDEYQAASRPIGLALAELVDRWNVDNPRAPIAINSRAKTYGTLIEKVRRGTRLSTMQHVIGFRISATSNPGDFFLSDQDAVTADIVGRWAGVRITDRRAIPSSGYRAVHAVVEVDGVPAEIQIRTHLQDVWAN